MFACRMFNVNANNLLELISHQPMVPTTILNRLEAAPAPHQRKHNVGESLKSQPVSVAIAPQASNGQAAPAPEYLITMGIPHQQVREQVPMDLTSRTPMLLPAAQHHSAMQHQQQPPPPPRCIQTYPAGRNKFYFTF